MAPPIAPISPQVQQLDGLSIGIGLGATVIGGICQLSPRHFFLPTSPASVFFNVGLAGAALPMLWNAVRAGDRLFFQKLEKCEDRRADGLFLAGALTGLGAVLLRGKLHPAGRGLSFLGCLIDITHLLYLVGSNRPEVHQASKPQVLFQLGLTFLFRARRPKELPPPSVPAAKPSCIRVFDPSEIQRTTECLGQGGFAAVYRVRLLPSGDYRALKLFTNVDTIPEVWLREQAVASQVAMVDSPYIVRVDGFVSDEATRTGGIVMEALEGLALDTKILEQRGAVPVQKAVGYFIDYSRGVSDLHLEVGYIHRDLTPANLWVPFEGNCKIFDFSVAEKIVRRSRRISPRAAAGTPDYMPPEAYRDFVNFDERLYQYSYPADVFSLGASFYETVTGRKAFSLIRNRGIGEDLMADGSLLEWFYTPPPPLTNFFHHMTGPQQLALEELDQIIRRSIAFYPDGRYQTADEMLAALLSWKERHRTLTFPLSSLVVT
ncbi:MAG: serine/threonine protein kinase [Deltaproteobacteria bacterium]|nr:serine/threonine protein kinase [Deltaproteobacteria bacterium]